MDKEKQVTKTNLAVIIGEVRNVLKYIWLKLRRLKRKMFGNLTITLSYIFLSFSVFVCLLLLIPSCFDRVPTLSYFISKLELPIMYELYGEVRVLNEDGDIVNKNVEVFIGGYNTSVLSLTEFRMNFSAPMTNGVFVVIRYEVDGEIQEFTKYLSIEDGTHVLNEEFIIYV